MFEPARENTRTSVEPSEQQMKNGSGTARWQVPRYRFFSIEEARTIEAICAPDPSAGRSTTGRASAPPLGQGFADLGPHHLAELDGGNDRTMDARRASGDDNRASSSCGGEGHGKDVVDAQVERPELRREVTTPGEAADRVSLRVSVVTIFGNQPDREPGTCWRLDLLLTDSSHDDVPGTDPATDEERLVNCWWHPCEGRDPHRDLPSRSVLNPDPTVVSLHQSPGDREPQPCSP